MAIFQTFFLIIFLSFSFVHSASWNTISTTPSYTGRGESAFTRCSSTKLCLLGGRGLSPVSILDTESLTYSEGAVPPLELHHFQAFQGPDGCAWVVGAWSGKYPTEENVEHIWTYCAEEDVWTKGMKIDRPRGSGGAFYWNGGVYIVGGNDGGHNREAQLKPWFDRLDIDTGKWSTLKDLPRPRDHFHAVRKGTKVYVVGGRDSTDDAPAFFSAVEPAVDVFDLSTNVWSQLPDFPRPRGGTFSALHDGTVFVMGGESLNKAWSEVDVLEGNSFVPAEDMPSKRHGAGAVSCNGVLWVAGGVKVMGGGDLNLDTVAYFDGDEPAPCRADEDPVVTTQAPVTAPVVDQTTSAVTEDNTSAITATVTPEPTASTTSVTAAPTTGTSTLSVTTTANTASVATTTTVDTAQQVGDSGAGGMTTHQPVTSTTELVATTTVTRMSTTTFHHDGTPAASTTTVFADSSPTTTVEKMPESGAENATATPVPIVTISAVVLPKPSFVDITSLPETETPADFMVEPTLEPEYSPEVGILTTVAPITNTATTFAITTNTNTTTTTESTSTNEATTVSVTTVESIPIVTMTPFPVATPIGPTLTPEPSASREPMESAEVIMSDENEGSPDSTGDTGATAEQTDDGTSDIEGAEGGSSPSPEVSPGVSESEPACFTSENIVQLRDGSSKAMHELQIGDYVKVAHPNEYSAVFFFSHHHKGLVSKAIKIRTTADDTFLSVSPTHLVYANNRRVPASTVRVGDKLAVSTDNVREAIVTAVENVEAVGLHNPHTLHGDIVVNGVVASTFTSTVHPSLAKILLAPFKAVFGVAGAHPAVKNLNQAVLHTLDRVYWRRDGGGEHAIVVEHFK